jgi:hypothetical protein
VLRTNKWDVLKESMLRYNVRGTLFDIAPHHLKGKLFKLWSLNLSL